MTQKHASPHVPDELEEIYEQGLSTQTEKKPGQAD